MTTKRVGDWIEALIEIPSGSRNKYEYDHERGIFRLDRVLYSSVHYPTDYGFIPHTYAPDGDPLDIMIIVEEPTFPGCYVRARPIGTLRMYDDMGRDDKILAVPVDDPRFSTITQLLDLNEHWQKEIENFFKTYKMLQKKTVTVQGWADAELAWELINESRSAYVRKHD
jgi:inorganic pyrophosphatase